MDWRKFNPPRWKPKEHSPRCQKHPRSWCRWVRRSSEIQRWTSPESKKKQTEFRYPREPMKIWIHLGFVIHGNPFKQNPCYIYIYESLSFLFSTRDSYFQHGICNDLRLVVGTKVPKIFPKCWSTNFCFKAPLGKESLRSFRGLGPEKIPKIACNLKPTKNTSPKPSGQIIINP